MSAGMPFGFGPLTLRRDPRADLLASLDLQPRAPAAPPPLIGYAAPPEPMFRGPSPPMPDPQAEMPAPPSVSAPAMDDRPWQVSDALAADPRSMLDPASTPSDARLQGREAGSGTGAMSSFLSGLRNGANLGFYDEAEGAANASGLPDWLPQSGRAAVGLGRIGLEQIGIGSGAGQAYAEGRDRARGYSEASAEAHPVADFAGNAAGGFALPFGLAAQGAGLATNVARGMATGAASGAIAGAGAGEGLADRAFRAGVGGTIGGTVGGIVPGIAGHLARPAARSAALPARVANPAEEAAPPMIGQRPPQTIDVPNIVAGPYGKAAPMTDDGMEAIRVGILRNLEDPTLGRSTAAAPAPMSSPLGFGPYGKAAPGTIEDGVEAIRQSLTPPSGWSAPVAPVVSARALGLGGAALGVAGGMGAAQAATDPRADMPAEGADPVSFLTQPRDPSGGFFIPPGVRATAPAGDPSGPRPGDAAPAMPPSIAGLGDAPAGLGLPAPAPQGVGAFPPSFGFGSMPTPPAASQRVAAVAPPVRGPSPAPALDAAPAPTPVPPPPARPPEFAAPAQADMPAVGAVPAQGQAAPIAEKEGPGFGAILSKLGDAGIGDQMMAFGSGLMTRRGIGPGIAAGFDGMQKAAKDRAATGLATAEMDLKRQKLAKEAQGENATRTWLLGKGMSGDLATAAMSSPAVLQSVLSQMNKDPSRVTIGGNIYELKPGQRPDASNLLGPAEAGPDTIRDRAKAQAEGAAAGKPDETYTPLAEDDRVARGYPAGSYQVDSKGKVSPINPTGTTINMGAEKAQDATVGKGYGDYQLDMATKGRNAGSTLNTLALMEQAMKTPGFYSGVGGEGVKRANQFLGALGVKDSRAASAAEVFDALSNKVVLDGLGGSLGPGISNTDRDYISRTAPTLAQSEQGNRDLIGIARSLAQRQQAVSKLARDYAAKNGGRLDSGFDQVLDEFANQNSLFPQARAGEAASAPKEPPQGAPQGARQAPDGKWYTPDPARPGKFLMVR